MKKVKDYYFYKAKKENYPARSVYKLEEIDKKFQLIKSGNKVLDLGAAPGSWTKYCGVKVGESGFVLGIDLQDIKLEARKNNIIFIKEDIYKITTDSLKQYAPEFDLVISDMAPSTTGMREVDQARSFELARQAFLIAQKLLKKGGCFVCKIFQGADTKSLYDQVRKEFSSAKMFKPEGSRSESFETYIVGMKRL
jgi:23S rRNA (uridine2552-2'-O)-methyltransferase